MSKKPRIPVQLTEKQFNEFVLKHLPKKGRGPNYKISRYKIFNYILKLLYMGCQWKSLPIEKGDNGEPEIHYTQIFRTFQKWLSTGVMVKLFETSVFLLHKFGLLDTDVIHGDGTTTMAKKGGDCLGYSGHKHMKSEKIVAIKDRRCNVLSPMVVAPGNAHEGPLWKKSFKFLKELRWPLLSRPKNKKLEVEPSG